MAQRDYVRRAQSAGTRRKKTTSRKTQRRSSVSPAMVVIAAAIVVAFVSALYFITHRKAEEIEVIPGHKVTGNGLPPKPEERWRYIKELENRQPGVLTPTEPTAGGQVINSKQLTNEQRQLLEQMQADMRQQQPMQLNEVPWNEQTTAQRQKQVQAQQQSLNAQAQARVTEQPRTQPRVVEQPIPQPRVAQTQPPKATAQPYQDLVQTPPHTQQTKPVQRETAPVTPVTRDPEPVKRAAEPQEKKDDRRWMVQCGSFKGSEQAETVRAQLAFEGFDSRITTNNGWNRVVIGPLKGKENADNTISRLKIAGHGNCIRLAFGG